MAAMQLVRRFARASLFFAALGLPACTGGSKPAVDKQKPAAEQPAPPVAAADNKQADTPAPATTKTITPSAADAPTITLKSPGDEPRQQLRFSTTKGFHQNALMTMDMTMALDMGMQKLPKTVLPTTRMVMDSTVTDVSAEGDIHYEFKLRDIEVVPRDGAPEMMVSSMKTALAGMDGLKGSSTVSNRGVVKAATFEMPESLPQQMRQTMDSLQESVGQVAVPLPEEAVGVGATWEATSHITRGNGINMTQKTSYELVSVEGSKIKLKISLDQTAEPQTIKAPGMPTGADAKLLNLQSSGSGETLLDLSKLAPIDSTISMESKFKMAVKAMGQEQNVSMEMGLVMGFKDQ